MKISKKIAGVIGAGALAMAVGVPGALASATLDTDTGSADVAASNVSQRQCPYNVPNTNCPNNFIDENDNGVCDNFEKRHERRQNNRSFCQGQGNGKHQRLGQNR